MISRLARNPHENARCVGGDASDLADVIRRYSRASLERYFEAPAPAEIARGRRCGRVLVHLVKDDERLELDTEGGEKRLGRGGAHDHHGHTTGGRRRGGRARLEIGVWSARDRV